MENTKNIIVKISTSRQRSISLYLYAVCLTVFDQFFRVAERVAFNLVNNRNNTGNSAKLFKVANFKIADSDRKSTTGLKDFFHVLPCV